METPSYQTFLVDDDADECEIFAMAVATLPTGIQHTSMRSGSAAVKHFSAHPQHSPDIIFLDLNMPRMNGMECYAELRKIDHLARTPICIYSTNLQMLDGLFEQGDHVYFLEKPTDIEHLALAVKELLENVSHSKNNKP